MRMWNDCWNEELGYDNALKVTTTLEGGGNCILRGTGVLVWGLHVTNSTAVLRETILHKRARAKERGGGGGEEGREGGRAIHSYCMELVPVTDNKAIPPPLATNDIYSRNISQ